METIRTSTVPGSATVEATWSNNVYKKITWRIMPLFFLCYVVAFMDRVNVGFAKLQMLSDLNFSEAVYGFGAGIFFIGYFLFEVPSNIMMHKFFGARKWIARIMITWGLLSAAMAFVHTATTFYLIRFFLGVAEAGFFPGVLLYFTYWYPARRHGKAIAIFATSVPIAGIIGGPISGWILREMGGFGGLRNWQWLFILEGIPSIILGIIILIWLVNNIKDANWLSAEEKAYLTSQIEAELSDKIGHSVRDAFRNRYVWMLAVMNFGVVMGIYGISFWLPTILRSSGIRDVFLLGLISTLPWIAAVFVMVLVGQSADKTGERRWHTAAPAIIGALALGGSIVFNRQPYIAITMLTVATAGIVTAFPQLYRMVTKLLEGVAVATGLAIVGAAGNLAGFVGIYFIGILKDRTGSTDAGMYGVIVMILIAGLLVLVLKPSMVNDRSTDAM